MAENSGGTLYYLLSDHLGSTATTLNSAGARVTELRYYPYGAARYNPGGQVTTYRFTGQRWDSGTALYFYGARWYDPAIGRFLQADTIVPNPGDPQSLNRYSYVGNRPTAYVDPSGHAQTCADGDEGSGCGYAATPAIVFAAYLDEHTQDLYLWSFMRTHRSYDPMRDSALSDDTAKMIAAVAKFQVEAESPSSDSMLLQAASGVSFLAMVTFSQDEFGTAETTGLTSDIPIKRAFRSDQDRFLRKDETGLSVYIGATDEEISVHLQGDVLNVAQGEVQGLGMAVNKTPGAIKELDPYHYEIIQGVGQTWNQFKKALKSLPWRK